MLNKHKKRDVVLVFLLLTLNIFHSVFSVSIVGFEQVNVSWVFFELKNIWIKFQIQELKKFKISNFQEIFSKIAPITILNL